ncbi:S8/S53 family peptidase [Microbacterium sp. B35-30]|uniref:S8 family peptidase n=1 Tax=Microbacterium sp. B35-30 TaxID=1962642 RepID=UPI0013D0A156|nr:S8/S53 family peptidase [Microbacterium sp. B35-30]
MPDPQKPTHTPRLTWRQREARRVRAALLDPDILPVGTGFAPTVYEPDVLLLAPTGKTVPRSLDKSPLAAIAERLGWTVEIEDLENPEPQDGVATRSVGSSKSTVAAGSRRRQGVARTKRVRIGVAPDPKTQQPLTRPDAARLLVEARRAGVTGIGLNHVLSTDSLDVNPFKGNPFKGNPFKGNPFKGNPFKGNPSGIEGYAYPGLGGRQPVTFIGGDLPEPKLPLEDRPVVAILDTGHGSHPWLDEAVIDAVAEYGGEIGIVDGQTDPDRYPSIGSPLDGVVDSAAGHGTFIAGIVLQACPEARILPVRIADGDGLILENDLIAALGRLVDIVEDTDGGGRIDVVNLSFSFYHETPERQSVESELYDLLARLRRAGTVVVCSAGNDATDRPAAPASMHHWDGADCGIEKEKEADLVPLVTVGALNPSRHTVALFSNIGEWVQTYVRGVSVLSIIPVDFEGGIQSDLRSDEYGHRRETLDLDDFRSGFAVWSGTSFAAPLVAGRIAQRLAEARGGSASAKSQPLVQHVSRVVKEVLDEQMTEKEDLSAIKPSD